MSKFINEIINDIRTNPHTWKRYGDDGMEKGDVIISNAGNGHRFYMWWATSIIEVNINGKNTHFQLSWSDKYYLEETFLWWIRNASLLMMKQ